MSASKPASPTTTPKKPRSPVERAIVWGGILLLLVLCAVEYTSKQAHSNAVESLLKRIKDAEESGADVKSSDVKIAVGNKVPRVEDVAGQFLANGGKRLEIYSWFSVSPLKKREMYVYYGAGDDPDVLSVSTEVDNDDGSEKYAPLTEEQKEELKKRAAAGKKPAAPAADQTEAAESDAKAPADEKPGDGSPKEDK